MNIKKWFKKVITKLSHLDNPRYEALVLLSYVSKMSRSMILSIDDINLNKLELINLDNLIYRRSVGEPMAYLLGEKEFWSLPLYVSHDTLIPRPDTEILVEQALLKIKKKLCTVLDLGCGCGSISLSIASTCLNCDVIGIDNSKKALIVANANLLKLNLKNVSFFYSNWFSHINKKFDIIVSNPPYISLNEIDMLSKDLFFEPIQALFSAKDGLFDIQFIINNSNKYLYKKGWLLLEHGWKQKNNVQNFFKECKFCNIQSFKDYGGRYRVTIGQKKQNFYHIL